jgi:hypothetical protein
MINPIEEYKFLKDVNNIKDIAHFTLFEKYMIQNKRGDDKKFEIEDTDQESIMITRNGGYPIPGCTYTFLYGEPDQIMLKFGQKNFIDIVPILFCMNNELGYFSGINMNMLPPETRLQFLESFYTMFKNFLEDVERLTQNDKIAMNKEFIVFMKEGRGQDIIKIFNRQNAANFNYGYRKYDIRKVKKLRMVEYNELVYLPFYAPRNAFRDLNYKQIHNLYQRSK